MNDPWWRLPGVQAFIERVMDDLDSGSNVILHRPPHAPSELLEAAERYCRSDYRHLDWQLIKADDWSHSTSTAIANAVACGSRSGKSNVTGAKQLSDCADSRVYVIDGIRPKCWPVFTEFLEQFRLANHERDESDRDVFLVPVNGRFAVPTFEIGLRVRRWEGIVQEIDSRLYLELLTHNSTGGLADSIVKSIVVELAGTDLELIRFLARCALDDLLTPQALLDQYASELSWCSGALCSWEDGGEDYFRSKRRSHSSVLTQRAMHSEIEKRVWHGQLTVIFPYLEERRIELVPRLRSYLRGKELRDPQGNKVEADFLELGSLAYYLRGSRVPGAIWNELATLRDVRHELAHLKPLDVALMKRFLLTVSSVQPNEVSRN